jgi:hypothetical protein
MNDLVAPLFEGAAMNLMALSKRWVMRYSAFVAGICVGSARRTFRQRTRAVGPGGVGAQAVKAGIVPSMDSNGVDQSEGPF